MKLNQEVKIVVLDRGFIFVGYVTQDEQFIYIDKASCIRRWGTTQGIGELRNGPLNETTLDPAGVIRAPVRALIFTIDCDASKWSAYLK
jgi:hypothetical protein